MDLYLSLVTGGTLYGITKDEIGEPRQLFTTLAHSNATVWVSTPSFAQLCLYEPGFTEDLLPRLKKFLFCGETLTPEVAASLLLRFPSAEVWNTYGPTEATCATTSIQITKSILANYSPLPVGRPKPDSTILVIKPDNSRCEGEERGEIIIAGPNVSTGYLGQPELTGKAFFQLDGLRAYRTGDLGHFLDEILFFDGRLDFQIKLHGYRIELGDIESNILAIPSVLDAIVLPHFKDHQPDFLVAFLVLNEKLSLSEFEYTRSLKHELRQRLPAYMLPHKFYIIDKFPLTANGKVDRGKLAEKLK
jgi:D-alanine--poly(phosphoribitol) ligase subunit 1